ncbi:patatin-like phospholipase family protein [Paludisphaera sp.]|uniref:patatin-like phospholipase family protein n=1 Tax=Paludisphaera sp. TaxID=2017432 RepID=UPI00301BB40C
MPKPDNSPASLTEVILAELDLILQRRDPPASVPDRARDDADRSTGRADAPGRSGVWAVLGRPLAWLGLGAREGRPAPGETASRSADESSRPSPDKPRRSPPEAETEALRRARMARYRKKAFGPTGTPPAPSRPDAGRSGFWASLRRLLEDLGLTVGFVEPPAKSTIPRGGQAKLPPPPGPTGADSASTPPTGPPDADSALMDARVAMLEEHVTGLAISGGGIRSATFAVGFLQGLANLGLLKRFDYLSTVSGGGYAGGWLAAWLKREGDVENVERQLDYGRIRQATAERGSFNPAARPLPVVDEEPQPLRHLRSFSSYLFPNPDPLSADVWTVVMIWIRNVVINLMMLFPLALVLALAARLAVFGFDYINAESSPDSLYGWEVAWLFLVAGVVSASLAMRLNAQSLAEFRVRGGRRPPRAERRALIVAGATLVAAFCLAACSRWFLWNLGEWLARPGQAGRVTRLLDEPASEYLPGSSSVVGNLVELATNHLDLLHLPSFLFMSTVFGLFMASGSVAIGLRQGWARWEFARAAFLAGASGGVLFVLLLAMIRGFARVDRPDLMATFAVPGALGVVIATLIVEVAMAGRAMTEAEREWWGRYAAKLGLMALSWMVLMGSLIHLPGLILSLGGMARGLLASGWIGTTLLGVLTGRFVLPSVQGRGGGRAIARLAALAPPVFLIGLGGAVGLVASLMLNDPSLTAENVRTPVGFDYYLRGVVGSAGWAIVAWIIVFGALTLLGFYLIDVNLFSLNAMYANRLARCYLGASRPVAAWRERWDATPRDTTVPAGAPSISGPGTRSWPPERDPNPVTGLDQEDDLPLARLMIGRRFAYRGRDGSTTSDRPYWGPHLLINTTLNLVAGEDLAWRSRKGESFLLSPLYCGSKSVGFRKLPEAGQASRNLTLGRAMSVSGAAVDPNMGVYQSGALTALLAVFNARLGWWVQNPRDARRWVARGPRFGGWLVNELFGKTHGTGDYVHLSDGGHFDNSGVYELIRRRCRYIVAVDAGGESDSSNSNLATLIRLCRIDFGVRIQIDTEPLRPRGDERLTRAHAVVGSIRYDDVDHGQLPGVLVYVRTSMTGDEPPDLQNYARGDSNFPYQPTDIRQSFDEEQFECYRCLGDHIATDVLQDAVHRLRDDADAPHAEYVPRLFARLQARWSDAAHALDEEFLESAKDWITLQRDLESEPALARLSRQIYPELPPLSSPAPGTPTPDYERAELHAVIRMLQIMENAWLTLALRRNSGLPINRGWLNTFRRWANTPAFQAFWPSLRPEYAAEFVRFCEDELHMIPERARIVPLDGHRRSFTPAVIRRLGGGPTPRGRRGHRPRGGAVLAKLLEEYRREWATDPDAPKLDDQLARSRDLAPGRSRPAWLIVQGAWPPKPGGSTYVLGIVLAADFHRLAQDFPGVGLASATPHNGMHVEFVVWVRRGYRSSEFGSPAVREIIEKRLAPALGVATPPTLWSRYPKTGERGDDDHERTTWLNFLARFDFRRIPPNGGQRWSSTLLRRG